MRSRTLALAAVALLFAAPLFGAEKTKPPVMTDIDLGKHISGEKWTLEDLKGRVVLAYYWNIG